MNIKKPRLKFVQCFGIFGTIVSIISFLLMIIPVSLPWILFTFLMGLFVSLLYLFVDFYKQSLNFYKRTIEVHKKHQALAQQFDSKNKIIDEYEMAFDHIGHCIVTALTVLKKSEQSQIQNLYLIYLNLKKHIKGEKIDV